MYTLYYNPSTASMVVHQALLEIGAPFRLELVDFDARAQHDPAYRKLNPHGVVPTLIIDGQAYVESAALLMILAQRHPAAGLAPPSGSAAHAAWIQWIVYLSNNLSATYRFWFYPQDLGAPEHPPAVREALQRRIEGVWDRLDAHLSTQGPYLLGEKFSAADLLLTMLMRWSRRMPRPATAWPSLLAHADLARARPSWKALCAAEGLTGW
jgi:glutathione S-transferase